MNGDKLLVTPSRLITDEIREAIRANRDELVAEVKAEETKIQTVPGEPEWTIHGSALSKWWTYRDLVNETLSFCDKVDATEYDGILGVPRSGLLCASLMAQRLGLPLWSFDKSGGVTELAGGLRMDRVARKDNPRILVVEDSSASGYSMAEAKRKCRDINATFAAVFATKSASKNLDLWHKMVPLPHWFEWNLFGNSYLCEGLRIASDMDGIICPDFTAEEDDDAWRYADRMRTMECLIPKGTHFHAIITARLEKYRTLTEHWLKQNEISYGKLIMGPWETKNARATRCMGSWKWVKARSVDAGMFIESDPMQAEVMASKGSIPIICPEAGGTYVR